VAPLSCQGNVCHRLPLFSIYGGEKPARCRPETLQRSEGIVYHKAGISLQSEVIPCL
jgi:hypothetical protein